MTPLALAADLEAKHKALVEARKWPFAQTSAPLRALESALLLNLPTLLTALRESGEAIERAAKAADEYAGCPVFADFDDDTDYSICLGRWEAAQDIAATIRALKPEPSR